MFIKLWSEGVAERLDLPKVADGHKHEHCPQDGWALDQSDCASRPCLQCLPGPFREPLLLGLRTHKLIVLVCRNPEDGEDPPNRTILPIAFLGAEVLQLRECLERFLSEVLFRHPIHDALGKVLHLPLASVRPLGEAVYGTTPGGPLVHPLFGCSVQEELRCLEGTVLHGNVHCQPFVGVLCVNRRAMLQHVSAQSRVALLGGNVQRCPHVTVPGRQSHAVGF
mmetsp:Transcript_88732/g.259328  ORF Transcript_88732/g.259328 Transcript_88732/m.259328 type:complete len:223 (-) Transcript_88732:1684-2352(-)